MDSGWPFILLALGGVLVNLVGVLFFLAAGEDCHHHGGGLLSAHSHSHDHGCARQFFPEFVIEALYVYGGSCCGFIVIMGIRF